MHPRPTPTRLPRWTPAGAALLPPSNTFGILNRRASPVSVRRQTFTTGCHGLLGSVRSMRITIAICTFNRAALLRQCLDQMARMLVPPEVSLELLVVNNNCTDETDAV